MAISRYYGFMLSLERLEAEFGCRRGNMLVDREVDLEVERRYIYRAVSRWFVDDRVYLMRVLSLGSNGWIHRGQYRLMWDRTRTVVVDNYLSKFPDTVYRVQLFEVRDEESGCLVDSERFIPEAIDLYGPKGVGDSCLDCNCYGNHWRACPSGLAGPV